MVWPRLFATVAIREVCNFRVRSGRARARVRVRVRWSAKDRLSAVSACRSSRRIDRLSVVCLSIFTTMLSTSAVSHNSLDVLEPMSQKHPPMLYERRGASPPALPRLAATDRESEDEVKLGPDVFLKRVLVGDMESAKEAQLKLSVPGQTMGFSGDMCGTSAAAALGIPSVAANFTPTSLLSSLWGNECGLEPDSEDIGSSESMESFVALLLKDDGREKDSSGKGKAAESFSTVSLLPHFQNLHGVTEVPEANQTYLAKAPNAYSDVHGHCVEMGRITDSDMEMESGNSGGRGLPLTVCLPPSKPGNTLGSSSGEVQSPLGHDHKDGGQSAECPLLTRFLGDGSNVCLKTFNSRSAESAGSLVGTASQTPGLGREGNAVEKGKGVVEPEVLECTAASNLPVDIMVDIIESAMASALKHSIVLCDEDVTGEKGTIFESDGCSFVAEHGMNPATVDAKLSVERRGEDCAYNTLERSRVMITTERVGMENSVLRLNERNPRPEQYQSTRRINRVSLLSSNSRYPPRDAVPFHGSAMTSNRLIYNRNGFPKFRKFPDEFPGTGTGLVTPGTQARSYSSQASNPASNMSWRGYYQMQNGRSSEHIGSSNHISAKAPEHTASHMGVRSNATTRYYQRVPCGSSSHRSPVHHGPIVPGKLDTINSTGVRKHDPHGREYPSTGVTAAGQTTLSRQYDSTGTKLLVAQGAKSISILLKPESSGAGGRRQKPRNPRASYAKRSWPTNASTNSASGPLLATPPYVQGRHPILPAPFPCRPFVGAPSSAYGPYPGAPSFVPWVAVPSPVEGGTVFTVAFKHPRWEFNREFNVSNQGQFKTELCNNWRETGSCPYKGYCRFAHGVHELRGVLRHPRYKTIPCRMIMSGKACIYGDRCHFRHSLTSRELSLISVIDIQKPMHVIQDGL